MQYVLKNKFTSINRLIIIFYMYEHFLKIIRYRLPWNQFLSANILVCSNVFNSIGRDIMIYNDITTVFRLLQLTGRWQYDGIM
jgi:hypothetical protein